MIATKPIIISGAGLSGLLLARSLEYSNIKFIIYDRQESSSSRAQGYRIRISTDGIDALRRVLSEGDFERVRMGTATTGDGGVHNVDAITGEEIPSPFAAAGEAGPRLGGDVLGVARGYLRQCLFQGREDVVQWGKQSVGYSLTEYGVVLKFEDGTQSPEGSFLVAADGPYSAIAKQLTEGKVRAYDTGARMIHGQSPASAFRCLRPGVWGVQDESHPKGTLRLITNLRLSQSVTDNAEVGWVFVGGPGTFEAPGGKFSIAGKVAANLSRELTAKWHSKFQPIFREQIDSEAAFLKMSTAHPDGVPEWKSDKRVTLMGDAVHCMTPAGGVGANTALRDAALLGQLLRQAEGNYDAVSKTYEVEMRAYASKAVRTSFYSAAKRFGITDLK